MGKLQQYFSGVIQSCVTGFAMMGKTADDRVIPVKLNDDGSLDIGQEIPAADTFKLITTNFQTNAEPADGDISNTQIISSHADTGIDFGEAIPFDGCGNKGTIFSAKLLLRGVVPSQAYRLYLFTIDPQNNFNNGSLAPILFMDNGFVGTIDFTSLISTSSGDTVYDGFLLANAAFQTNGGQGSLFGILQNNNGATVNIPAGTQVQIKLGILSN